MNPPKLLLNPGRSQIIDTTLSPIKSSIKWQLRPETYSWFSHWSSPIRARLATPGQASTGNGGKPRLNGELGDLSGALEERFLGSLNGDSDAIADRRFLF